MPPEGWPTLCRERWVVARGVTTVGATRENRRATTTAAPAASLERARQGDDGSPDTRLVGGIGRPNHRPGSHGCTCSASRSALRTPAIMRSEACGRCPPELGRRSPQRRRPVSMPCRRSLPRWEEYPHRNLREAPSPQPRWCYCEQRLRACLRWGHTPEGPRARPLPHGPEASGLCAANRTSRPGGWLRWRPWVLAERLGVPPFRLGGDIGSLHVVVDRLRPGTP